MGLFDQPLVCVDVETDGVDYRRGHVIEIAAIRIEHGEIVDEFSTLIDPGVTIPYFITNLTGITTHDVQGKPSFDDIAERLLEIMEGAIFVAHNVRFDYSFIKQELARVGLGFNPKMLCTVRLSRALHPAVKGHKLSDLISRHDFNYSARHRAYDDAHILWQFLQYAGKTFDEHVLEQAVSRQLKIPSLPHGLDRQYIDTLPHATGVYIFEDENGAPLYIGKSIDIKKRVLSHFTQDSSEYKEFKMSQRVTKISYTETSGEMSALLLESHLIKQQMPLFNRRLRRKKEFITAKIRSNSDGYDELEYRQLSDVSPSEYGEVMGVYATRLKAKSSILTAIRTFELCPKLCGIEKASGSCFSYQLKRCKGACIGEESTDQYNRRLRLAFERTAIDEWPYKGAISLSEDISHMEGIIVDQWRITARFVHEDGQLITQPYHEDFDLDAYKIVKSFLLNPDDKLSIKRFEGV
jgi:DNA polymerase III subunit epsilon